MELDVAAPQMMVLDREERQQIKGFAQLMLTKTFVFGLLLLLAIIFVHSQKWAKL